MGKEKHIKSYSAVELDAFRLKSGTDLNRVDTMTEEELERAIAEDDDEKGLSFDWTRAQLVLPKAKQSVHLRLEQDVIDYFKSEGKGHIAKMQAVLKAYVNAHRLQVK